MSTVTILEPAPADGGASFARARRLRAQRGALGGLQEMLLYILVGVLIAVGIYMLYGQITTSNRTASLSQQVNTLVANTRALYASSPGYGTGPMNATLIAAQAAPPDVVIGTDTMRNTFGGQITVEAQGASFRLTVTGIPRQACTRIATQPSNAGSGGGPLRMIVGSSTVDLSAPITDVSQFMQTVTGACAATGSGASGGNTLAWDFS
jgi:hypothetical protein